MNKKTNQSTYFKLLLALLFLSVLPISAQTKFTDTEQQVISVRTLGLFDKSNKFTIDFKSLPAGSYSFPLPVGKARLLASQALEITTQPGDIVLSMFSGTVRMSRRTAQYGNVVIVRHDNGLETVYGHNAQNLVKVGQRVKAGQKVAIVGRDGGRTYTLFAIMVDGGWINPTTIIDAGSHKLRPQNVEFRREANYVKVSVVDSKKKITSLDPDDADSDPLAKNSTFQLDLQAIEREHWSYPLAGAHVISPYGGRGGRPHSGVDIKTRPNDKVLAAFDGVVTQSGPYFGYGNYIVIRHAYGFSTCYSHQSRNYVKKGQKVKAGQVIGLTGRTGRATTEHLHFEIRFKGRTINPNLLFDHVKHKLRAKVLTIGRNGAVR